MSDNTKSFLWKEQRSLFLINKRKCRMCGNIKELSQFYRLKISGFYFSICKECSTSKWNKAQKDKYHSDSDYKQKCDTTVKRNIARKREEVLELLGNYCVICHGIRRLNCHEIHGRKHNKSPYYIFKHIEDFILLCNPCHSALHICLENLDNFKTILKRMEIENAIY